MTRSRKSAEEIESSSGNVFADFGLPDTAELDTKVRLAVAINRQMKSRRLTQTAAAHVLSINQPKVSALKHYQLDGFSVERLILRRPAEQGMLYGSLVEIQHPAEARSAINALGL